MKTILLTCLCSLFLFNAPTIYDYKVNAIEEKEVINFSNYKGKKILIVNTASRSPFTYQLEGLQMLYLSYKQKLVVVGIPAGDDFDHQELKTNNQIRFFYRDTYGITFPMSEKVDALGSKRHALFQYLADEAKKLGMDDPIKNNFVKFLLDENGQLIKVFPPEVTPLSTELTSYLNNSRTWSLD